MKPLPDIKEQFKSEFYDPLSKDPILRNTSVAVRFDLAQQRYEEVHNHQLPFQLRTFQRVMHKDK